MEMAMLSLLGDAGLSVQVHIAFVCVAVVLAPLQIFRQRRDRLHKLLGYVWVTAMAGVALSSFWITELRHFGPFSVIHLVSAWVLYALVSAVLQAVRGDIEGHSASMRSLAFWSLFGAGAFTFLPYRLMNRMFFPDAPEMGLYLVIFGTLAAFGWSYVRRVKPLRSEPDSAFPHNF